ncbi:hypothetical protein [Pseudoalteromonas marina]|uniref:hypothetical protein n=1 Tax=Pseudoalteromonas marina TaxID=267375 RepID=UPI003C6B06D1
MTGFKTTKDLKIEELEIQLRGANNKIDRLNDKINQMVSEHSQMIDNCIDVLNKTIPTEAV